MPEQRHHGSKRLDRSAEQRQGGREDVLLGECQFKWGILVAISGIVLILPLSAFESKAAMHQTYTQVSKMFEQGQNAT
jgi:hypothetical protein